jgi:hypothetical protein
VLLGNVWPGVLLGNVVAVLFGNVDRMSWWQGDAFNKQFFS